MTSISPPPSNSAASYAARFPAGKPLRSHRYPRRDGTLRVGGQPWIEPWEAALPATGPGHGGPARGYSWPPFAPGNQAHLKHGASSTRHVHPLAAELVEALLLRRPDLADFPEATWAWGRAEARCLLLEDYHARQGFLDEDGNVRGGGRVATFEAQAARLRERLGLDPVSDVQLQRAKAEALALVVDLEGIRERGWAVLERRRAELAAGEDMSEGVTDGG